jgi:hypothetical protein
VQNILDPSAIVEPRFASYTVLTKDRRVLSGLITAESASSLTLAGGAGATETVARAAVKDIRASSLSMMPEGFESAITPEGMAHLIAFLRSTAGGPKAFPGNAPAPLQPAGDGTLLLPAAKAALYGGDIEFEAAFQNVGSWRAEADHVVWTVRAPGPAITTSTSTTPAPRPRPATRSRCNSAATAGTARQQR